MLNSTTLFRELLNLIPNHTFRYLITHYEANKYSKSFTAKHHLISLFFIQIRQIESIRDLEISINRHNQKLYQIGFGKVKLDRSTFAEANSRIDYRLYQDLFYKLHKRYITNLKGKSPIDIPFDLYAIDASYIDLVTSLYPWAKYKTINSAVKLHTIYDLNRKSPTINVITEGDVHDLSGIVYFSKKIFSGSILVFDKGYWSIPLFRVFDDDGIYFVTRLKQLVKYEIINKEYEDNTTPVRGDYTIKLNSKKSLETYLKPLRLVHYHDNEHNVDYEFITNNFELTAMQVALVYKNRWEIETFFKWIKQNLIIKSFLGTSRNAVYSQIWVGFIYYMLLSYLKQKHKYPVSLKRLSLVVNEELFSNLTFLELFNSKSLTQLQREDVLQLSLF